MRKSITIFYSILLIVTAMAFMACGNNKRIMSIENATFMLDGNPFVVASAELDYARTPREYWSKQLDLVAGMGYNTVTVKVPWMLHEPTKGNFDFTGMNDVKEFCRIAQQKGLLVWLHIGPYVGAEWDMGGLPWWLLNVDGIRLRSRQPQFMQLVDTYFAALGAELGKSLIHNGGNIAIVQIEESDGIEKKDKEYLQALLDCAKKHGFDNLPIFTAATKNNFMQTSLKDAYFAIDMNSEVKADEHFVGVTKFRVDVPLVCSSLGGDYKTVWGGESANRNWNKVFMRMFELLQRANSVSMNGIVGGNSFGATAGARISTSGKYEPYTTVHNSDALITPYGGYNDDYFRFGKTLHIYAQPHGATVQKPADATPLTSFNDVKLSMVAPLFENLPAAIESGKPLTMEQCNVTAGALLYSTKLPAATEGCKLQLKGVHDYAQIFIDGKPFARVDRREVEDAEIALPSLSADTKLDILVDATGRVGNVKGYKDYKGITKGVAMATADGASMELTGWSITPLPSDHSLATAANYKQLPDANVPGYYKGTILKPGDGDFFLYMGDWGKGHVWINGHHIGRFWSDGPQQALYVPACWLNNGSNEIIVLDWIGPEKNIVKGLDYEIM